ncbi:MAG: FAD-dependent oxidoreductase [Planctomycetota bacterium]|nr:FAD-dependent oxidoreductase [Planctomycetota bacterium]MEC9046794.1 FAD-dependent oxidoreductase [Planctomycetota bacterium]
MTQVSTGYRVAVVGSGPAAFYTAEALFKNGPAGTKVDLFDRLPVPFGLVRGGVAPDHQKIKSVTRVYDKIAANDGFRFFGNVQLGRDISVSDLNGHYHHVVYAFGCESDNKLGLDGEDLEGVYAATDFVGWYNGHPDHRGHEFHLAGAKRVALVGNGNVAMDVARVLLADPDVLAKTDIADHALATLRESNVEEVILLGRRGPAQAAFSPKEIQEIHEIDGVDVVVRADDGKLDELSAAWLEAEGARSQQRNVEFLAARAAAGEGAPTDKKLRCRFLVAPAAIDGSDGKLGSVTIHHMQLEADSDGTPRPKPTGTEERLEVDLLFKAIGYRGDPVEGVPYEERKGIVPNVDGRVVEQAGGEVRLGHYCAGWCKRGPTGLIGTNSLDAKATVAAMLEDQAAGALQAPAEADIGALLATRSIDCVTWEDWQRLDQWERQQGEQRGKLRHKLASVAELMKVIVKLRAK